MALNYYCVGSVCWYILYNFVLFVYEEKNLNSKWYRLKIDTVCNVYEIDII